MKLFFASAVGLMVLTACAPNPETSLDKTCNTVMADPDVARDILEANLTVADYCVCATKTLLALPEVQSAAAINALETMEAAMVEHDGSAEKAFRAMREAARADEAAPEAVAAYESMDAVGEQLEDILDGLKESGGTCSA